MMKADPRGKAEMLPHLPLASARQEAEMGKARHNEAGLAGRQGCSKVRPVEERSCSAALKSEGRNPKPERSPKPEFREWPNSISCCSAGVAINSDFGLRASGLGFGMARTDFRAALGRPFPREVAT